MPIPVVPKALVPQHVYGSGTGCKLGKCPKKPPSDEEMICILKACLNSILVQGAAQPGYSGPECVMAPPAFVIAGIKDPCEGKDFECLPVSICNASNGSYLAYTGEAVGNLALTPQQVEAYQKCLDGLKALFPKFGYPKFKSIYDKCG